MFYLDHFTHISERQELSRLRFENQIMSEHKQYEKNRTEIGRRQEISYLIRNHQWPAPKFLLPYLPSLPDNCYQYLPDDLLRLAQKIANSLDMSVWEVVLAIIASISCAIPGVFYVDLGNKWIEPVLLYTVFAKKSGSRKSALLRYLFAEHYKYQDKLLKQHANRHSLEKNLIAVNNKIVLERGKKKVESLIFSGNYNANDLKKEIAKIASSSEMMFVENETNISVLIADSFTPTGIEKVLRNNGGAVSICSAEDPFSGSGIEYPSRTFPEVLLKGFDAEEFGRATGRKSNELFKPYISMFVTMTPENLLKYYDKAHLINNGFLNRILPCFLDNYPIIFDKSATLRTNDTDLEHYYRKISDLLALRISMVNSKPISLRLNSNAYSHLQSFSGRQSNNYATPSYLEGFIAKLPGKAIRMAACLHVWRHENPHKLEISDADFYVAQELCTVLGHHADYGLNSKERALVVDAKRVLSLLVEKGVNSFTLSDISKNLNNMGKNKALPVFDFLSRKNYLMPVQYNGAIPNWVVNPLWNRLYI